MGSAVGGFVEDVTGINMGSHSAADAAVRGQQNAANQANATQLQMYNQTREDMSPYREAGGTALSDLASGNVLNNFQGDPGYQFRLNEGMKALQNSAAARGSLNSGATLKALTQYGQNFASNEYNNAYNREYTRLSNLANLGQNAAAQMGAAGQNYANAYGQNVTGMANAEGAMRIGQANQLGNFVMNGGSVVGSMLTGSGKPTGAQSNNPYSQGGWAGNKTGQFANVS